MSGEGLLGFIDECIAIGKQVGSITALTSKIGGEPVSVNITMFVEMIPNNKH